MDERREQGILGRLSFEGMHSYSSDTAPQDAKEARAAIGDVHTRSWLNLQMQPVMHHASGVTMASSPTNGEAALFACRCHI